MKISVILAHPNKESLNHAIIDIDHFKNINDTYGHLVGNDSLKIFSAIIKKTLRETDISGRYGGDEFILIFLESTPEQGMKIVTRIKTLISETKITSSFLMRKKAISLTFSAGLTSFSQQSKSINDLINAADKALYQTGVFALIMDEIKKKRFGRATC